eukprot:TRINITY_DN3366_c0_g1_i1.p1 TRINITY_DN3366_c0_g1~~TRINITY_DN3366_c0_g1_i1.p1  ORF type:complete len:283 (-),score=30.61 TRINITY_DN3366_c0_g1_i1:37-885(-)
MRRVLITGANRGLGFALSSSIASRPNIEVIATARTEKKAAELARRIGGSNIVACGLDVSKIDSIQRAVQFTLNRSFGFSPRGYSQDSAPQSFPCIDILINNAGVYLEEKSGVRPAEQVARQTVDINYYGVLHCMQHFLPLMNSNGRIVNFASTLGRSALRKMSPSLREQLLSPSLTIPQLNVIMEEYVASIKDGTEKQKGFPLSPYGVSKAGVIILTHLFAKSAPQVLINCVCPGFVKTDMGGPNASLTVEQGIVTPLHLAFSSDVKTTGGFWREKRCLFVP